MTDKDLKAAIAAKRIQVKERIATLQEDMLPDDADEALLFYTGVLNGLTFVVDTLNTPVADPLAGMVGMARPVRRGRKG